MASGHSSGSSEHCKRQNRVFMQFGLKFACCSMPHIKSSRPRLSYEYRQWRCIVHESSLQCFVLCFLFRSFSSCLVSGQYPPSTILMLHEASLVTRVSVWIQTCVMAQVLLLFCLCHFYYHHVRPHLAPRVCCSPLHKAPP